MVKQGTRILLLGGGGFVGSAFAKAMAGAGASLRIVDDFSTGRRDRLTGLGPRVEVIEGDARDPRLVAQAMEGAQHVVDLVGAAADADPREAQEIEVGAALAVLDAAKAIEKQSRPRVLLVGSGAVYGTQATYVLHEDVPCRPATPRGVIAQVVEGWGRVYRELHGVPVMTLRLFRVFGPEEEPESAGASVVARFVQAALAGTSPVVFGDGQQARDFVYIENVVAALAAALGKDCDQPLNIASGEAVTVNFLWTLVLELVGKRRLAIEPTFRPAPPWEQKNVRPQIARACKVLHWAPSVRLREGLQRTIAHRQLLLHSDPNAWFAPREVGSGLETRRGVTPLYVPQKPRRGGATPPPPPPPPLTPSPPAPLPTTPAPLWPEVPSVARMTATTPPRGVQPLPQLDDPPVEIDDSAVIEDRPVAGAAAAVEEEDMTFEWAPVPSLPGVGR
jgi:UDP-glucose 4-epimerase